jgi:6-phosphogluconolactonase (cycloisomerase 2 family)
VRVRSTFASAIRLLGGKLLAQRQPANAFLFVVLLCVAALAAGCVISPRRTIGGGPTPTPTPTGSPSPTPVPGAPGKLYVANPNNNSILRFDNANTADANLAPAATIVGTNTTLTSPQHIFIDAGSDTLYVANQGSVLAFQNVSTHSGTVNIAPDRTITGPATGLVAASDVAFDDSKNLLYVANNRDVLVFANASTATANAPFGHDISVGFVISALFLDSANDRLYLADSGANAIHVFDNASQLNGSVPATRTISGTATQLNQPSGIAIDAVGKLIVSNKGNSSITVYVNAAAANNNQSPVVTILGASTTLNGPGQIAVNNSTSLVELFVANPGGGNVPIYSDLGSHSGDVPPSRNINGPSTGHQRHHAGQHKVEQTALRVALLSAVI